MAGNMTMFNDYPDILDVKEVQTALKIGRHAVYYLINSGSLRAFKLRSAYKVTKEELIRYVRDMESGL